MAREEFGFKAQTKKLLDILAKSLYEHKEVFLRELISNASDALSKMHFIALTNKDYKDKDLPLEIKVETDNDKGIVRVIDSGIGMTKDELINNLGTIAKSGAMDFIQQLQAEKKNDIDIIGQFGIGFYSVFMVARLVRVYTRSYKKDEKAYMWESDGSDKFVVEEIEDRTRGTTIEVVLNEDSREFVDVERLKGIIKKHSNFVRFPIIIDGERVNDLEAIWTKSPSKVSEKEYEEFYRYISNFTGKPIGHLHIKVDSPVQFASVIYIPDTDIHVNKIFNFDYGIDLYSSKILIKKHFKDFLPDYLRFVVGMIDSEDIPLNISRESIQHTPQIARIQKVLVSKIISYLGKLAKDKEKYNRFYERFGKILREGVSLDFSNRDKLISLLRYYSTFTDKDELISLDDYINQMKDNQSEIYFIVAENRESAFKKSQLEIFIKNNIPVLLLYDPADELILNVVHEYKDKRIVSIDNADKSFIAGLKGKEKKIIDASYDADFEEFLGYARDVLKDRVKDVIRSDRLIDEPCCLVGKGDKPGIYVQKLIKMVDKKFEIDKPVLEVNPDANSIKKMVERYKAEGRSEYLKKAIELLYSGSAIRDGYIDDLSFVADSILDFVKLEFK